MKHTHRVHVPIITNDKVDFTIGHSKEDMQRVKFESGIGIELNNQAFHSVVNNSVYMHMIEIDICVRPINLLDYSFLSNRILLLSGQGTDSSHF